MKNKMKTPLETLFSNNEKKMFPCNDETFESSAKTLVIQFDQEKFEEVLSGGGKSPSNVHKHRKISVVRSPLITVEKQVFDKTKKAICRPESASCEAKQTCLKSVLVSTETRVTSRQHPLAALS